MIYKVGTYVLVSVIAICTGCSMPPKKYYLVTGEKAVVVGDLLLSYGNNYEAFDKIKDAYISDQSIAHEDITEIELKQKMTKHEVEMLLAKPDQVFTTQVPLGLDFQEAWEYKHVLVYFEKGAVEHVVFKKLPGTTTFSYGAPMVDVDYLRLREERKVDAEKINARIKELLKQQ